MRVSRTLIPALFVIVFVAGACRPPVVYFQDKEKFNYVVARVDKLWETTMEQLYDSLYNSQTAASGGVVDTAGVRYFLDSMLCDTLAGLRAKNIRLEDDYAQYHFFRARYHNYLIGAYTQKMVYDSVSRDSAQVVEFYNSHPEFFSVPEQIFVKHIMITGANLLHGPDSLRYRSMSREQLDLAVAAKAREIRAMIDSGQSFEDVARKYSEDMQSRNKGGSIGWVGRGYYQAPFDSVAFAAPVGSVAGPYKDENGWHIISVDDYLPEGIPPLTPEQYKLASESYYNYHTQIFGKRLEDSLFAHPPEVVYNDAILDTNVYKVEPQVWAAIVNGRDTIDFNDLRANEETYRTRRKVSNTTLEMKKEIIDVEARRLVFVQAAINAGLDTLPEGRRAETELRQYHAKQLVELERVDPDWAPSDSLVEAYYNAHQKDWAVEKPYQLQYLIVEDSSFGEFLRAQIMSGIELLDLAQQYFPADSAKRRQLADLGWVSQEEVPPPIWEAASSISVGEASHAVRGAEGWYIVYMVDQKELPDLGRLKPTIVTALRNQHARQVFNRYRDGLYSEFGVTFPGRLRPVHLRPLAMRDHTS